MARALDLAWRGWGRVHPNPMVGATVLAQGALVGEGWHAEFGDRHAEPIALRDAGDRARGSTLVVTLEPCAHRGKQPPCTEAIVRAGVRRVVVALSDPDPVAAGGADRLRAVGLEIFEVGQAPDSVVEQARLRNPRVDPGTDVLGHAQRLAGDGAGQDRQRRNDEHEQHHDGERRSHASTATKPPLHL